MPRCWLSTCLEHRCSWLRDVKCHRQIRETPLACCRCLPDILQIPDKARSLRDSAINFATAFRTFVSDRAGEILPLTGKAADYAGLIGGIKSTRPRETEDAVIIYLIGHGYPDRVCQATRKSGAGLLKPTSRRHPSRRQSPRFDHPWRGYPRVANVWKLRPPPHRRYLLLRLF